MGYLDNWDPVVAEQNAYALENQKKLKEQLDLRRNKREMESLPELGKFWDDVKAYNIYNKPMNNQAAMRAKGISHFRRAEQIQNKQWSEDLAEIRGFAGITPEEIANQSQNGYSGPMISWETGDMVLDNTLTYWDASARGAYGPENELGLIGIETEARYWTTRLITGGNNFWGPLSEKTNNAFAITANEAEAIAFYTQDHSSYARFNPLDPDRWSLSDNVIVNAIPTLGDNAVFNNIPAALSTEGLGFSFDYKRMTAKNFFFSRKDENWDAENVLKVFAEEHPGILGHLDRIGLSSEELLETKNKWDFRFQINEALTMQRIGTTLSRIQREGTSAGNSARFVGSFAINTFKSVDMVGESALAVATWGTSAAASIGLRGRKLYQAYRTADNFQDRLEAIVDFNKTMKRFQDRASYITGWTPSNLPHTIVSGGFKKAFGSQITGQTWREVLIPTSKMWWQKRGLDFAVGTVEGGLYGAQNMLSERTWDNGRFWEEVISEGVGQTVAGPAFRTVFGTGLAMPVVKMRTGGLATVYDKLDISPEVRVMINEVFAPAEEGFSFMTQDQQSAIMTGKIMMALTHENWNSITGGTDGVPATLQGMVTQIQNHLPDDKKLNIHHIIAATQERLPVDEETGEKVVLNPREAAIAVTHGILTQLDQNGRSLTADQENAMFRNVIAGNMVDTLIADTGGDPNKAEDRLKAIEAIGALDEKEMDEMMEIGVAAFKSVAQKLGLDTTSMKLKPEANIQVAGLSPDTISNLQHLARELNIEIDIEDAELPPHQLDEIARPPMTVQQKEAATEFWSGREDQDLIDIYNNPEAAEGTKLAVGAELKRRGVSDALLDTNIERLETMEEGELGFDPVIGSSKLQITGPIEVNSPDVPISGKSEADSVAATDAVESNETVDSMTEQMKALPPELVQFTRDAIDKNLC